MLLELGMTLTTLLGKYFLLRDYPGNPEGVVRDTRVSLMASYNIHSTARETCISLTLIYLIL